MIKETQILNVAKQLISYYGPQKTTMKDIAERLSVSPPYLLKYYEDKGALIIALISSINQDLYDEVGRKIMNETNTFTMLDTALRLKIGQYKTYFRLVHSLPYLERLGNLQRLRQDFTCNNNRIAELIMQLTVKDRLSESGISSQSLFDVFEETDKTAESFIIKYLPHGDLEGYSFRSLYKDIITLKSAFVDFHSAKNHRINPTS